MPRYRTCSSSSSSSSCDSSSSSSDSDSSSSCDYNQKKPNVVVTEKECRKKIIAVCENKQRCPTRPCERVCRVSKVCKKDPCKRTRSCSRRIPNVCRRVQKPKCRTKSRPRNLHFCTTVATEDCCGKVHTFSKCYSIPDMRYSKG
nr:hypothetical transcript [Hymenolepis microstoma]